MSNEVLIEDKLVASRVAWPTHYLVSIGKRRDDLCSWIERACALASSVDPGHSVVVEFIVLSIFMQEGPGGERMWEVAWIPEEGGRSNYGNDSLDYTLMYLQLSRVALSVSIHSLPDRITNGYGTSASLL